MSLNTAEIKSKVHSGGTIEVICGSMFSGKTEELIRRLRKAQNENLVVEAFKPAIDTRYDATNIVSHDMNSIQATPVENASSILSPDLTTKVVGIDEAQFFDKALPDVCIKLAAKGIRVIVAGLDMDFKGRPFEPVPTLMAIADEVTKLHAICAMCGSLAVFSYRTTGNRSKILLGEKESYEPRCRQCFNLS